MPSDRQELYDALLKADAAGDTASAQTLADYIRSLPPGEAPAEAPAPEGETGAVRTSILSAADTAPFAKQTGAVMRTIAASNADDYAQAQAAGGLAGLAGGEDTSTFDPLETYRAERDAIIGGLEAAQEENPVASGVGTGAGIVGQVVSGGVNPYTAAKSIGSGLRGLITTEGRAAVAQAGRQLLTREGAKTAAVETGKTVAGGAGFGAAYGLSESEADLTRGEFAEAAADTLEAGVKGGAVALVARALLAPVAAAQGGRVAQAEGKVAKAVEKEREQAVRFTGLDGKQKTLGGAKRAKDRAQALYAEPSPQDPRKTLLQQVENATPDERLEYATRLRQETGQKLGAIRDELAKVPEAGVSAEAVKQQFRGAFAELPTEVQAKALEQVDGMIGALAKGGKLTPAALRKLIEDTEGLAKFGTPNLEAALGNARGRVFQSARGVLVANERELIAKALPERAGEYTEALRKYGVYSDFEMGSKVMLERANKGLVPVKEPRIPAKDRGMRGQLLRLTIGEDRARAAETIMQLWGRLAQPTVTSTSAKLKKLERLQPMMEEAMRKGPGEVARVHALFMQRSPDYRKAVESE